MAKTTPPPAASAKKAPAKVDPKADKNKPMSKSDIASMMAEKVGITKKQAGQFFEEQATLAYKEAKRSSFTIPGIGKLLLQSRAARMGRNPATGESIKIPAKKVVKFRLAKAAKDAIGPVKK